VSTQVGVTLVIERTGVADPAPYVITDGNGVTFPNDGNVIVKITNPSGAPATATVISTATVSGEALADKDIAVAAGITKWAGPWPPVLYNDSDGLVTITVAGTLDISFYGI
jgi:hypothetical protein